MSEPVAVLPTLGRPIVILGVEFFAGEMYRLPNCDLWVLILLPPTDPPKISGRIAFLRDAEEVDLLDQAAAALNVLSTRYGREERRGDHFYTVNRALREVDQVREIRAAEAPL